MCGIAGIWRFDGADPDRLSQTVRRMADALWHRGPDAEGNWVDGSAGLGLGHRRLSIVDLSAAGAQPMVSACGRYVISYNGEIYNADAVRASLAPHGIVFRGHSDTEVVLEACARWGVTKAASTLIGIFAFAVWDRQERVLSLVRDPLGVKPLYWGHLQD